MHKSFLLTGALLSAFSIALGAFGAHGLKAIVSSDSVSSFQTGVQYQMYHSWALILVGIVYDSGSQKLCRIAGWLFLTGIVLFSGSLYLLTFLKATQITGISGIGLITPLGGLAFIAGWISLFFSFLQINKS
jgi:uncharacterized membrane protein YgdD (TMEM256/DUF423 family)